MSLAALESGLAFSQTKTTACHSVSYPLTIHYGIPHGLACGLTLPHFLEYNYHVSGEDCLDKRGVDFVKKRIEEVASFLGTESVEAGKETIRNLMRNINLPTQIDFDVEMVVKDAFAPERVANNPRRVTEANLRKILEIIQK
jgi:alcohol dehydrogenase class IV